MTDSERIAVLERAVLMLGYLETVGPTVEFGMRMKESKDREVKAEGERILKAIRHIYSEMQRISQNIDAAAFEAKK